jgi:hypothetical protein
MYRALKNLSKGGQTVPKGDVFCDGFIDPKALEVLIARGSVGIVSAPPLEVLPGWKGRASKLAKKGIVTVDDLVKAETEAIGEALRIKADVAEKLKAEALNFLKAPEPQG